MSLSKPALVAAAALAICGGPLVRGQAPASQPPGTAPAGEVVVGSGNFSPMIQDLDKAIDFYGGLLGLTVPPPPASGQRPLNTDPGLLGMFGMPGAQLHFVTARIPGAAVGVEMVEVRGLDKKAMRPRPQDAGVVDVDPARPRHRRGVRAAEEGRRAGRDRRRPADRARLQPGPRRSRQRPRRTLRRTAAAEPAAGNDGTGRQQCDRRARPFRGRRHREDDARVSRYAADHTADRRVLERRAASI